MCQVGPTAADDRSQAADNVLACADLVKQHETKGDDFPNIVTRDETWVHQSKAESKQQFME
jgi:hypothetical protein